MKIANVKVPQGLGDIFWCYQKLYNYFDEINFKVYVTDDQNTLEMRSMKLFDGFPKVGSTTAEVAVPDLVYQLPRKIIRLDDILKPDRPDVMEFEYIVNRWLELGNYLEDIDEKHEVAWDIELPKNPVADLPPEYIVLYVSGDTRKLKKTVWQLSDWARLIQKVRKTVDLPVVIVGAGFDSWVHERMGPLLQMFKIPYQIITDLPIKDLCYVLDKAELLLGYQSGISILADALDTKQLMVYFNGLPKMRDRWVKPVNRGNGVFNYCFFKNTIDQAYEIMKASKIV